jgi:hypothetical protein
VSLALHSILGGAPAGFHVTFIRDRHFWFSVSTKQVGFTVSELKRIISDHFDVYFHLWRDGGANWYREWNKWQEEENASWQHVSRHHSKAKVLKHVSFAKNLVQTHQSRNLFLRKQSSLGILLATLILSLAFPRCSKFEIQISNPKNR